MRNWRHTWERFWGGHYRALGCLHLDRAAQIDYLFLQRIGRPLAGQGQHFAQGFRCSVSVMKQQRQIRLKIVLDFADVLISFVADIAFLPFFHP